MCQTFLLLLAHCRVVNLEDVDRILVVKTVLVSSDYGLCAAVDAGLSARGGFLNTHLRHTGFDGFRHTAELLNLLDVLPSLVRKLVGEALNIVRTGPRVNMFAYLCLVLDVNLRVAGDARREVGRQGDGLVERVGVQALGVAEGGCHSLNAGTADVVERVLLCERPT